MFSDVQYVFIAKIDELTVPSNICSFPLFSSKNELQEESIRRSLPSSVDESITHIIGYGSKKHIFSYLQCLYIKKNDELTVISNKCPFHLFSTKNELPEQSLRCRHSSPVDEPTTHIIGKGSKSTKNRC